MVYILATYHGIYISHLSWYHVAGAQIRKLNHYVGQLETFFSMDLHTRDQREFREGVLSWHHKFLHLQNSIHADFDMDWSQSSAFDNIILILYIVSQMLLLKRVHSVATTVAMI